MINPYDDMYFMKQALQEAQAAAEEGEIPVGAVITCQGKIIARAHNQTERLNDVTAHAEMLAITAATNVLGAKYLTGCTLYVTLELCPMCAGAILNSRISRVVYGSTDSRFGGCGTTIDVLTGNALQRAVALNGGILADECLGVIRAFFQAMRAKKGLSGTKPNLELN